MRILIVSALIAQAMLYIPAIALYGPVGVVPLAGEPPARYYDTSALGDGFGRAEGMTWGRTDTGRMVLLGHNPGGFSDLDKLQVGDQILIYWDWSQPALEFRVIEIGTVPVSYGDYLFNWPIDWFELDLITCYGDQRLIVRAMLVNHE